MAPLVRIQRAAFGYRSKPVIEEVELEIEPGQFLGVAGPNGAGKTTLLRGIAGLLPPLGGEVERGARALGYVPQRESLDPVYPLSVQEVVDMGAYGRLHGLRGLCPDDRELVRHALERVDMLAARRKRFANLSGGQRQRVLMARALVMQPDLLLLDEPTSGIDRAAEEAILGLLGELSREGVAVLLVSHQLATLRQEVEELLWVEDHHVQRCDPQEFLSPEHLERLFVGVGSP